MKATTTTEKGEVGRGTGLKAKLLVALLAVFAALGFEPRQIEEPPHPANCERRTLRAAVMASVLGPMVVLVPYWFVFIIVGCVLVVVVYVATKEGGGGSKPAVLAYVVSAVLICTGVSVGAGAAIDAFGGGNGGEEDFCTLHPNDPSCIWTPDFDILVPSTPAGGGRDANTEVPGSPFTQAGSLSPAASMITYNTDTFVDPSNKRIEMQVDIDDDLGATTAGYQTDDCFLVDWSISLQNGRDADGDSNIDAVTYFGRIRSITRTTMVDGNSSQPYNVFYWDTTNGWYIGWMKESASQSSNGDWISAYPAGVSDDRLPTGTSEWKQLGSHAGGSAEYISFWFVARNYGIFGYTQPPVGQSVDILVDIGTVEVFDTWTVVVKLNSRD